MDSKPPGPCDSFPWMVAAIFLRTIKKSFRELDDLESELCFIKRETPSGVRKLKQNQINNVLI